MTRQFKTIFMKELKDTLRDRRAMMALLYFVVGSPLLLLGIFYLVSLSDDSRPTTLYVDGVDQAPGLVAFVEKAGLVVEPYDIPEGLPTELPEDVDGMLRIPDDFADQLASGMPIELKLFVDEGSTENIRRGRQITSALAAYGGHVAGVRLRARGVPLVLVQPVALQSIDLSEGGFQIRFMSGFLLLVVIMAPFTAGMSVAIDVLAGERERNSLQPLLALPVSATTLALGKWAVVASFGIFGTIATALVLFAELNVLPAELVAFTVYTTPFTLILLVMQLVPLALFVGALQMFLSIMAKSFREAQTLLSIVMMVPFMMAYISVVADDKLPDFARYLPILADLESASSLILKGTLSLEHYAISLLVSLVGTFLALSFTIRRLDSERLLDSN